MRVWAATAGLLLLAGCATPPDDTKPKDQGLASPERATEFLSTGSPYDYRYAYRLPGAKVKAVLQSHADGCDRLGPGRCKIEAMRYRVDTDNHTQAVLTIKIDPALARGFGDAATQTVTGTGGALVDTELTGADGSAAVRSATLIGRLREQLSTAQTTAAKAVDPVARKAATDRAARIQSALDTIADVESATGQTAATSPVLFTYESSTVLTGLGSPDASFSSAGDTLVSTLAGLAQILAGVGPWLILMIVVVAVLRWVVQNTGAPPAEDHDHPPLAVPASEPSRLSILRRWFNTDAQDEHQG